MRHLTEAKCNDSCRCTLHATQSTQQFQTNLDLRIMYTCPIENALKRHSRNTLSYGTL